MQQVKLFKGIESDVVSLENEINAWIKSSGARIVQMSGNIAPQTGSNSGSGSRIGGGHTPSDVLIVIVYETDR